MTDTTDKFIKLKPIVPPKPKLSHHLVDSLTSTQLTQYNSIITSLKEKMSTSQRNSTVLLDEQDISFNLLDEIYAEIEDKQIKSTIKELPKYCASLSCSSSSYTSASSNQSNNSCTCLETAPPPLPSMPPPPLNTTPKPKSRSSSILSRNSVNESLSLEQEIELEIKNKFSLLLKSATNDESSTDPKLDDDDFDNDEDLIETDYLEPINLVQQIEQIEQKNNNKTVPSPSYRLKTYFQTKLKESNINSDKTNRASLNYLIKQSNRISTTLRNIRTKSHSCNEQTNDLNLMETTLNSLKRTKKRSTSNNSQQLNTIVQISNPTLISQTFDLRNQNLIEINNNNNKLDDDDEFSTSSFSSSDSSKIDAFYHESVSSNSSSNPNGTNVYEEQLEIDGEIPFILNKTL